MSDMVEREDNGLRDEHGALIGGLVVFDYLAGIADQEAGAPPPDGLTSASYDLGRLRASEKAEQEADFAARLKRDAEERHARVRAVLAEHPDVLAAYDRDMAALSETPEPVEG